MSMLSYNYENVKFLFVSQNSSIECEVIRKVKEGVVLCRLLDKDLKDNEGVFCSTIMGLDEYIGRYVRISVKYSKGDTFSKYQIELKS